MSAVGITNMTMDSYSWGNISLNHELSTVSTGLYTSSNNYSYPSVCASYILYQSYHVQLSHKLNTILCIGIIFIGVISNLLGMIVFCSRVMRKSTSAVYLFYLALSDTLYLIVVFLARMLESIKCLYWPDSSIDLNNQSEFGCKSLQYLLDACADFSACIILVVTIERYVACYYPIIYKKTCSVYRSRMVTYIILGTILIVTLPHHILLLSHYPQQMTCDFNHEYATLFNYVFLTEVTLLRIIPTFAITVFNSCIVVKLWKRAQEKQKRTASDRMSTSSRTSTLSCYGQSGDTNAAINLILVLISTTYIICYQPILILYMLSKFPGLLAMETIIVFRNYSRTLYIFGYAVNFFFYTLGGPVFRKQVKLLLSCKALRIRKKRSLLQRSASAGSQC